MANDRALLQATSAGIAGDGSTYVVLRWEAIDGVEGYNLYRRIAGSQSRPARPINGRRPITPPSSARQLRAVVPEGSPEWEGLARGFTAAARSTGSLELANPAVSFERGLTERELHLVRATAQANLAMGHAAGLAYTDRGVKADEHYLYAATFVVQRATSPGGPFQQVNPKPVAYDMDSGLDGQPLAAPQPGFLDIGAWDADGHPTSHQVEGGDVYGP